MQSNSRKRVLSAVLAVLMLISLLPTPAFADFSYTYTPHEIFSSSEAQSVTVVLSRSTPFTVNGMEFTVTSPEGWELTELKNVSLFTAPAHANTSTGRLTWWASDGVARETTEIATAVFTVKAGIEPGEYTVKFDDIYANNDNTDVIDYESATATITVLPSTFTVALYDPQNVVTTDSITVTLGGTYADLPILSKEGCSFLGWFTAADSTGDPVQAGDTVAVPVPATLYAHWSGNTYTVTWNDDNGHTIDTTTVAHGEVPTHAEPTKAGYTFAGWTPAPAAANADVTYTAVFVEDPRATVTEVPESMRDTDLPLFDITTRQPLPQTVDELEAEYIFTAVQPTQATKDYFGPWRADYRVTFTGDYDEGTFGLYGAYNGLGVAFRSPRAIHNGDSFYLLTDLGLDPNMTYAEVVDVVGTFTCGVFNLDGSNALSGKNLKVDLVIWPAGETPTNENVKVLTETTHTIAETTTLTCVHNLTAHAAVAATCTEAGNSVYWSCEYCGKYFSDAAGTTEIAENSWVIAAQGHNMTEHAAVAATCTEAGNSAYWSCDRCNKYFSDAAGRTEIAENSWVIAAQGHNMTEHVAVDATCTEAGNSAYWSCDRCNKYFSDAAGENEIAEDSWVINATGHEWENDPVWTWNGINAATATFTCTKDNSHTQTVNATITSAEAADTNHFMTYTATVNFNDQTYTNTKDTIQVTFNAGDGTVAYAPAPQEIEIGGKAQRPENDPEKTGYIFSGWRASGGSVFRFSTTLNANTEILASWSPEYHTITWMNDGSTLQTQSVAYGETPAYTGETPAKAATAQYTYTFAGWDPAVAEVTGDATYTATFTETVNQYTVTFVNDGTEISSADYDYGTAAADITVPADPTKAADANGVYTFAGWTPEIEAVTADATYTATYTIAAPVAKIGEAYYESLRAAIAAAGDGATIELIADDHVSFTASSPYLVINKNITINGNGKAVYGINDYDYWTSGGYHFIYVNGANLTINELQLTEFGGNSYVADAHICPMYIASGTVNLNNVTIDKFNNRAIVVENGAVSIDGCTITGDAPTPRNTNGEYFQHGIAVINGTTTITNTTVTGMGAKDITYGTSNVAGAIQLEGAAALTVNGGTYSGDYAMIVMSGATGALTVEDGTFTGEYDVEADKLEVKGGNYSKYVEPENVVDGKLCTTVVGTDGYYHIVDAVTVTFDADNAADNSDITTVKVPQGEAIPAIQVPADPTKAAGEFTYAFAGWSDGTNTYAASALPAATADVTYTAVYAQTQNVAVIGGTYYTTLEAAFAAANDGDTIVVLADSAGNGIQVPQGKFTIGLTVDFASHTYTMDGEMVGSPGTKTQAFQLLKDNTLTFKNGTIYSEKAKMLVQNYSNLTLDNMTLTLNNASYTGAYTLSNNNGSVVIKDTTINANDANSFAFDVCRYSSYPSVSVTVTGSSQINGNIEVDASNADAKNGMSLMLDSGTLNGEIKPTANGAAALVNAADKASVKEKDTFNAAKPDGFQWISNGDGTSTLKKVYTVTFVDEDGTTVLKEATAYVVNTAAADIVKPADPTKAADGTKTYTFTGWIPALADVTEDVTYTAVYEETENVAKIGDTYYETLAAAVAAVDDNEVIELLADSATANAENGKTFTIDMNGHKLTGITWVTDNTTLTIDGSDAGSTYEGGVYVGYATNNNGNVVLNGGTYSCGSGNTVLHINGTCLDSDVTISNAKISSPDDNGIQLNGSGTFVIENSEISGATGVYVKSGNLTITNSKIIGTMNPADYSYYGNGANATGDAIVIDSCKYPGGAPTVTLGEGNTFAATKNQIGYYEYAPEGQNPEAGAVEATTASLSIPEGYAWVEDSSGKYDLTKVYTVTFVDEDGTTVLKEATVYASGTAAADIVKPADPTKAATAQYSYTFDKWVNAADASKGIEAVTADVTYKATYTETVNQYNVTFVDEDGTTVLKAATAYDYGTAAADIVKPTDPTKAASGTTTYTFTGWDPALAEVTEDVTYTAVYEETENVAKIGGTYYTTLEAAFAAANDGDTITVLADSSGNGIRVPQGKFTTGLTVDFADHTYTMDGEMVGSTGTETQAFQLLKDNTLTFKNGTIYSEKAKMLVQNYSNLTLDNMTLTLNNASYTGAYTLSNNNGSVVIKDTTINANDANSFAFDVCRYSSYPSVSVTVTGNSQINGNIEVDASNADAKNGMSLMLDSGTLTGEIKPTANGAAALVNAADKANVTEKDTFQAAEPDGFQWISNGDGTSTLKKVYTVTFVDDDGTTVLKDATAYVVNTAAADIVKPADPTKAADGTKTYTFTGWDPALADVTEDVTYTAVYEETENVAKIGDNYYTTLAEAFTAAQSGDTIVLLKDTEITSIEVGKAVKLDLDGKTVSSAAPELFVVTSSGDLTITGNGTITGPTNGQNFDGKSLIKVERGTLTVENGTLTATGSGSDGMYGVYVLNGGTATFGTSDGNGPTITSHFAAIGTNNTTAPATITVYGGTYTANAAPTNNEWWSYFCAPVYAASNGSYTLSGGTFNGYYGISSRYADTDQTISISGNAAMNATSGTQVFMDSKAGSSHSNTAAARVITSPDNAKTLPEGYGWDGDATNGYVAKKLITVTADAKNKVYGANDPALTYTATGLFGTDSITGDLTRAAGEDVGAYAITQGTLAPSNDKYMIAYTGADFTITPMEITVTITGANETKTYDGDAYVAQGYTVIAPNGVAYSSADVSFSGRDLAVRSVAGTTYMGLEASQFTNRNPNYNVTFSVTDGYVTINRAAIEVTVTGNTLTADYDGTLKSVTGFTADADHPLYNPNRQVRLAEGKTAEAERTDAGTTYMGLTADSFTNTNVNFDVTFVVSGDGSLTINPINATVTIIGNSDTKTYNGSEQSVTGYTATAEPALYDVDNDFTFSGTAVAAGTNAGSYPMGLAAGQFENTDTNFSTVTFNITDGSLTIEKAAATVTVDAGQTKVYGETDPELTATVAGLVGEDTLNYTLARAEGVNVGEYALTVTLGENPNYNVTAVDGTFTITPKAVTVTADDADKYFSADDPNEFTATVTGLVGSDTVAYTVERAAGEEVGTYAITPYGDAEQGNYSVTYVPGNFTIKAAVAKIGDDYYTTLADAFTAANGGDTIELLTDYSVERVICNNDSSFTLDLGDHTLTARVTFNAGTVTVQNGTINGRFDTYDNANVTLASNATVNGQAVVWGDGEGASAKTPTLNVYGKVTNTGDSAITTNGTDKSGAKINVYDGAAVTSTNEIAIYQPSGSLTINGGTITGTTAVYTKSGTLRITGGELNANGTAADYSYNGNGANATGDALVVDNCNYPNGAPSVTVSGGAFNSANGKQIGSYYDETKVDALATVNATSNEITIRDNEMWLDKNDGTYDLVEAVTVSFDTDGGEPAAIEEQKIAKGNKAAKPADPTKADSIFGGWFAEGAAEAFDFDTDVTESLTLTAKWGEAVAKIGDAYYATLADAFTAAQSGDTIVLLKDTEITSITVDKAVTLDLSGKTVSSDGIELFVVTSSGDLTITGNGTITGPEHGENFDGKALITVDGGTLTVENGTLTATGSGSDGMYGVYVLANGSATFGTPDGNGPTITSHFAAIGENHMTAPATITVYGGTYTANATPTNNEWWSYFCAPVYAAGSGAIDIKGGEFNGYYGLSDRYADVDQTVTLSGGTFNASSDIQIFADEVNGSGDTEKRAIKATVNTLAVPEGYGWIPYGDDYLLTRIFTVTFIDGKDAEGEDNVVETQTVALDAVATRPEDPSKKNFSFEGWFTDEELTEQYVFSTPVTENLSLYAKWAPKGNYTHNLNLNDDIDLRFYIRGLDDVTGVTVTFTDWNGNERTMNITDGEQLSNGGYRFALAEYKSTEMTEKVHVVVKDANGEILLEDDYSVQEYCNTILTDPRFANNTKMKELAQATLDYGSAAQIYFDYKATGEEADLANPNFDPTKFDGLTVPDTFAKVESGSCTGVKKANMSLSLEHKTALTVSFVPKKTTSPLTKDAYEITVKDANGVVLPCEPVENASNGRLVVKIVGISAENLDMNYTFTIRNKTDNTEMSLTASALSYAYAVQGMNNDLAILGKALYNYYLKAEAVATNS